MFMNYRSLIRMWQTAPVSGYQPFHVEAFYTMLSIDFLSNVVLCVAGVLLLRLARPGLALCNVLFIFEIAYTFIVSEIKLSLGDAPGRAGLIAEAMGALVGVATLGTAPQELVGYPIIALIALNIAFRKLKGTTAQQPGSR